MKLKIIGVDVGTHMGELPDIQLLISCDITWKHRNYLFACPWSQHGLHDICRRITNKLKLMYEMNSLTRKLAYIVGGFGTNNGHGDE